MGRIEQDCREERLWIASKDVETLFVEFGRVGRVQFGCKYGQVEVVAEGEFCI